MASTFMPLATWEMGAVTLAVTTTLTAEHTEDPPTQRIKGSIILEYFIITLHYIISSLHYITLFHHYITFIHYFTTSTKLSVRPGLIHFPIHHDHV